MIWSSPHGRSRAAARSVAHDQRLSGARDERRGRQRGALTYAEALVDSAGERESQRDRRADGARRARRFPSRRRRAAQLPDAVLALLALHAAGRQTADEPLRVHDLRGIFTAYPFAERGRFASDVPWLADMWRMNWNGARIGAFETYMDTPYWEQLQYVGDTRLQGLISLYVSGDDRLLRQAIEHFDLSRIPEGITTSRYPRS